MANARALGSAGIATGRIKARGAMAYVPGTAIDNTLMEMIMTGTGTRANAMGMAFKSIKMAGTKARGTMANGRRGCGITFRCTGL